MPVPAWPGLESYPGSVLITALVGMLPEMAFPDFVVELVTITVMVDGTLIGGGGLFPALVLQVPPHAGGFGFSTFANPLNPSGAAPPLSKFCFDQELPQNVTFFPATALRSPITKLPF